MWKLSSLHCNVHNHHFDHHHNHALSSILGTFAILIIFIMIIIIIVTNYHDKSLIDSVIITIMIKIVITIIRTYFSLTVSDLLKIIFTFSSFPWMASSTWPWSWWWWQWWRWWWWLWWWWWWWWWWWSSYPWMLSSIWQTVYLIHCEITFCISTATPILLTSKKMMMRAARLNRKLLTTSWDFSATYYLT